MNRPLRVLLIEDNPADAELAREYIKETGFCVHITTANDGQKAIDLYDVIGRRSEERPDLVLLDLNLPRRSGYEVLRSIRHRDDDVKVIIYSGSRSPEDTRRAKENQADGYLVKPMSSKEMDAVIGELRTIFRSLGRTPGPSC